MGNLYSLVNLKLINNKLTSLPNNMGNLSSLTHLDLLNNPIQCVPFSLKSLEKYIILEPDKSIVYCT
jgi:Leucine-rich repeat (LRR) protein